MLSKILFVLHTLGLCRSPHGFRISNIQAVAVKVIWPFNLCQHLSFFFFSFFFLNNPFRISGAEVNHIKVYLILQRNEKSRKLKLRLLKFEFSERFALNWSLVMVFLLFWLFSSALCLKVVVVTAAGAALAETNTDLLSAPSTDSLWRTCPVAAAGKTSR